MQVHFLTYLELDKVVNLDRNHYRLNLEAFSKVNQTYKIARYELKMKENVVTPNRKNMHPIRRSESLTG